MSTNTKNQGSERSKASVGISAAILGATFALLTTWAVGDAASATTDGSAGATVAVDAGANGQWVCAPASGSAGTGNSTGSGNGSGDSSGTGSESGSGSGTGTGNTTGNGSGNGSANADAIVNVDALIAWLAHHHLVNLQVDANVDATTQSTGGSNVDGVVGLAVTDGSANADAIVKVDGLIGWLAHHHLVNLQVDANVDATTQSTGGSNVDIDGSAGAEVDGGWAGLAALLGLDVTASAGTDD